MLAYLAWTHGIDLEVAAFISLPIMILLAGCTLWAVLRRPFEIDAALFVKYGALTLVFALNLRRLRPGPWVKGAFVLANCLNILCGIAILAGSEWVAEFIPKYYWISHAELVPSMMSLHKPVLTFGSHSLAGFFLYLFFWANWENYRLRRNRLALVFALSYFILLLGLTSFTSVVLGGLALAQMGVWLWRCNPRRITGIALCAAVITLSLSGVIVSHIDDWGDWPQFAEGVFLNTDKNGPLSRYGPGGVLRGEVNYLFTHPLSPIGFERSQSTFEVETPLHFFIGDSGPLEYLVRGSIPLLFLIYFGLYLFLRRNLLSRAQALTLFLVVIAFETGFSALSSSRTFFLLPFVIIYLNQVASTSSMKGLAERHP